MKQISLRLPEKDWHYLKDQIEKRVGIPASDNYLVRYALRRASQLMDLEIMNPKCPVGNLDIANQNRFKKKAMGGML